MNKNHLTVVLFESCRLVKGASRYLLCDVQRQSFRFLPLELGEMLEQFNRKTIGEIKAHYEFQYDDIIDENLEVLEEAECLFFTDTPEFFPPMNMQWDEASGFTNAIVDIDPNHLHDFERIWPQLSELGVEHVQLRSFAPIDLKTLDQILLLIGDKRIISVELLMPYMAAHSDKDYIDFVFKHPRIFTLILHSAGEDKQLAVSPTGMGHIFYVSDAIKDHTHCGLVERELFAINLKSFTESLAHNTCLNRKISIDTRGNIKNCPSMSQSYGNIKETSLVEASQHPDFKKTWDINKDKIHACKDCEFRYICTDCRAYVEKPEDLYSKPLKCGYNPYTTEWKEWMDNPLKLKAMESYGIKPMTKVKA